MKRSLAFMLAMVMLLCLLPTVAFAGSVTGEYVDFTIDDYQYGLTQKNLNLKVYVDDTLKQENTITVKSTRGIPHTVKVKLNDGFNYVFDKTGDDGAFKSLFTLGSFEPDSNGEYTATGHFTFYGTDDTRTAKIYLKSRGSHDWNRDNIITSYYHGSVPDAAPHHYTHKVFEWRNDVNFTYAVARTAGVGGGFESNTFAAKLILELYNLNGTRTSDPDDVAYGWNMHGIDNKGLSITLASDKYWFESHATTGEENQAYYVLDNLGNGDNQVRFGSSAQKDAVQPSIKNLPRYFFRAFPLEIPLTNETLCTVHQVNKATDDTTTGHGKEMRYVKVYLNGQHQADADNTIGNNANAVYFPDRGVNMKESDIVVTNTELGNRYYREIVVDEDTKTYNIHYYNYIYKLNFDGNGATPNPASMTSGEQAVPDRSHTFNGLPSMERDGYDFLGWADSKADADNGTVSYNAGGSLTLNYTNGTGGQPGVTEKTIYAVWKSKEVQTKEITLTYNGNANGEANGVPAAVTMHIPTTETSATFTISANEPTREGYEFLGWADTEDATVAQYTAGGKITVSGIKTIYAVWKMNAPEAPDHDKLKELVGKVAVECTTGTEHGKIEYELIENSYLPGVIETDGDGNYTYSITINPESYVATYEETNGDHTLDPADQEKTVSFTRGKEDTGWKVVENQTTVPVVFTVMHATTVPGSVSEVTKTRLTTVPADVTLPENVTINKEETVTFTDNNTSATLLYEFTVKGTAGTEVTIADSGAKFFNPNNTTVDNSIEVTIGEDGTATVYGYKTFTKDNIKEGNLKNTATATNKEKPDDNATGSSDVPAEYKTTEITGEVKNVEKKRILTVPADVTLPENVTINKEETVIFTDNNLDATLLYAFKVTGTPGAEVVIKDTGATFIDDNGKPVNDKITVTLPNGEGDKAEITVYGYRTFNVDKINNEGKLVNTATANVESDDNNKKEAKAEVDAKDDRTLYNTLTVKKLVSGNAADQTEKFRFKATFTLPVPGASANLDGVTPVEKVEIDFELAHNQTRTFSYTSDPELKAKIDKMKESGSLSGDGDAVFAMLSYKVEETNTKGYTLATNGDTEGEAEGYKTVTFTNTKNKPNDDHGGHYHPTTTPVPVIVIPPKTGDMPFWYSIAQFLGLVK